jgi:hypothetical protein
MGDTINLSIDRRNHMSNISRRAFVAGAAATAAALALPGTSAEAETTGGVFGVSKFRPYSSDSFFKSSVAGAPIDWAATTQFRNFIINHPDQKGYNYPVVRGTGTNKWGTPYAEGSATDPVWKLTGTYNKEVPYLFTTGFHAPEYLGQLLTGTSDSPLVVMDRASGFTMWCANAFVSAPYTISVKYSGAFWHNTNGLDRRNPKSNGLKNFRSRGAIPDAMVIRKDLMDEAIANGTGLGHVLHFFMTETLSTAGYCHPMVGCEGSKYGWGAEGLRLAIDPALDITTRGLSPQGLVLAKTLQQNGMYLGDNSGSQAALKAQQDTAARPVWNGTLPYNVLKNITFNDIVVLPKAWQ